MTYTVKNGTWCKDNDKEYYSTTKAGLKAALAAGEITAGTKVVIHEPKYHAGQLIQSLNPNCPEGCFVPHGQTFNKNIYEELAKVFPSGVLPDMRECVMVCAGQNTHITTHEHDVFSAGEFKDDCAVKHSHTISVSDPGHGHSVTDPGHGHSVTDPGHSHTISVSDPGHGHTVSDPGHSHTINDPGHTHDVSITTSGNIVTSGGMGVQTGFGLFIGMDPVTVTGTAASKTTGVSVNNDTTGVSVNNAATGITASANSGATGVSVNGRTTGVSVNGNTTGITASCSTTGDNVTRTKQFGVYYYIAF